MNALSPRPIFIRAPGALSEGSTVIAKGRNLSDYKPCLVKRNERLLSQKKISAIRKNSLQCVRPQSERFELARFLGGVN